MTKLPTLSGYEFKSLLHQGNRSIVYRAVQNSDQQPVIIKFLNNQHPRFDALAQFHHQFDSVQNLDIQGIVMPLAIVPFNNQFALIMPDDHMISLHQFLGGKPLSLDDFLPLAIHLSQTLGELHDQQLIHKDIKPHNIIIHPQTRALKFIDFCTATLLPRQTQSITRYNHLEGTLAYISPEQTGRMNRGLDYRTDFYSLGATWYECLTGAPPFHADDTLAMLHCHIARKPQPPIERNPDIPEVLSHLILKLLAKNAEDRYQSAHSLVADLQRCQQAWQSHHTITDFTLGLGDRGGSFRLPEKLYGREPFIHELFKGFEQSAEGQTTLVLVTGASGIGKTALINEIHKPMTRERGYFVRGKFEQLNQNTPYFAITQALNELIKQLLDEAQEKQQQWQAEIRNALGDQGQLLIDIIPALAQLIGEQPAVTRLEGEAANHRFNFLFHNFIRVFSHKNHPLILFLDDLQWLDPASLTLLTQLLRVDREQALLVIGAYRDNEVTTGHPLLLALDELHQSGLSPTTLTLTALSEPQTHQLITDACYSKPDHTRALTQRVQKKTQGNPFYVHQFLKLLAQEKLLQFNASAGYWDYELEAIDELTASVDVVEFLAWQLRKLAPKTQTILQLAACLGNQFDLQTLALVARQPLKDCIDALWPVLSNNWLMVTGDNTYWLQHPERSEPDDCLPCRFVHDRVQEAAYSMVPRKHRASLHLKIGQLLQAQYLKKPSKKHSKTVIEKQSQAAFFAMINQLNQGCSLISEAHEQRALAQQNLQAGQQAQQSTAYATAGNYYQRGLTLLPDTAWDNDYQLSLELHRGLVECAALQSDYRAQAHWSESLLSHSHCIHDAISTHQYHCLSLIAQGQALQAIEYALPYLQQLGIELPQDPGPDDIKRELTQTSALVTDKLNNQPIASLINLPLMTDQVSLDAIHLLSKLTVAFYTVKPALYPLAIFQKLQLCLKQGNTEEMLPFYAAYGFMLGALADEIEQGYEFAQLALNLLDKMDAPSQKAVTRVNATAPWSFNQPLQESIQFLADAIPAGQQSGDLHFASSSAMWHDIYSWFSGAELGALAQKINQHEAFIAGLHQDHVLSLNKMLHQTVLNLLDQSKQAEILDGEVCNEMQALNRYQQTNDRTALAMLHIYKLSLSVVFNQTDTAQALADKAEQYLDGVMGNYFLPAFHFYAVLARLSSVTPTVPEKTAPVPEPIHTHLERLHFWARHNPASFEHKWALMQAEYCRVSGDWLAAEDYYDQAITGAQNNGFVQEQGLANERAAQFYLHRGRKKIAVLYMTAAYYAYAHWGAKAKVDQLSDLYPELLIPFSHKASEKTLKSRQGTSSETSVNDSMAVSTLIKASQSLSGELSVKGVLTDLMILLLEHAGAQRCLLLLNDEGQWRVAGESHVEETIKTRLPDLSLSSYDNIPHYLIRYVINKQQHLVLDDVASEHQHFKADPYFQQNPGLKSVLCQPIFSQNRLLGLLYLENELTTSAFHEQLLQLTGMLAAQAAISLENAQLYEHLEEKVRLRTEQLEQAKQEAEHLARTDPLTGISNRRSFFDSGKAELIRATRYKHQMSVIMLDIDHFKNINDSYGHGVGDEAIKALVSIIQDSCRINDTIARLGGEEFAVILPETALDEAKIIAERIRVQLEQHTLITEQHRINYTASFGISLFNGNAEAHAHSNLDELLEQADKGLYEAKEGGRNQVVVYTQE